MPPDPLQLRRRLVLQGGGFALFLLAAFSGSLYWGIASQRQEDQRTELRQLAGSAAAQLPLIAHETREAESSAKFRAGSRRVATPALQQQRLQWFDAKGALLSELGNLAVPPLPEVPRRAPAEARGNSLSSRPLWQRWPGGMSLWQPVDSQAERLGYVRVALSDQAARADLIRIQRGLLLGGVVTLLAALLVGRRMLRAAFLPLQRQVSALQRFTADASHELRHPLTALRAQLAAVPQELRQQPALAWGELDGLSRRMGELLDDLLLLARQEQAGLDGSLPAAELQAFDLLELLEDLLRCYAPQAVARSISLQLSPDPATHGVPFRGQSEQVLRLFTNLLVNAIRHSPEGGTVSVQVSTAGRLIRVTVADLGPGIPLQERERVFERFWSGADRGGHSGLGLAIGRAIARRHGGDLRLGESRPGRCELVVELPAASFDGSQASPPIDGR
ncbi:MAG: HAMP domain-containing sensor histidine kinase [Cyanobium sp.]